MSVSVQSTSGTREGRVDDGRVIPYKFFRVLSGGVSCGVEYVPCRHWLQKPHYHQFHQNDRAWHHYAPSSEHYYYALLYGIGPNNSVAPTHGETHTCLQAIIG